MSQKITLWWPVIRISVLNSLTDRADARFQLNLFVVVQPSIFDVQSVGPLAVALLLPAHVVVETGDIVFGAIGQRLTVVLFDLGAEFLDAPVGDQVLHSRDFAIRAIAVITLHFHDRFGNTDRLIGRDEGHPFGECGKGFLGRRCCPHAAADQARCSR